MSNSPDVSSKPRRHHWVRATLICLVALGAMSWAGFEWITAKAGSSLHQNLAARGVDLQYTSESWTPWHGLTLTGATLSRSTTNHDPLIELTRLHVDVLWQEFWHTRAVVTRWRTNDATLILHDAEGAVTLTHFTADLGVSAEAIDVSRLETNDGTLSFSLAGKIVSDLFSRTEERPAESAFALDLAPLRSVLSSLNFKPGTGHFSVTGRFTLDGRATPSAWQADLTGAGTKTEWRGLPLQEATIEGRVASTGLKLKGSLRFAKGSAKTALTRDGWEHTPLMVSGTLTDSAGQTDSFSANHQGATGVLTIAQVSGSANLLELASNLPSLAALIPPTVKIRTFPDIVAKDFVWHANDNPPDWTLASLHLRKPAAIAVMIRDRPLAVDHLNGDASYDHRTWHLNSLKGQLLGGSFGLDADYDGRVLSKANVSLRTLRLASLSPWLGNVRASVEESNLSLTYRGAICREPTHSTGSGTLELTHAPVVHVPLLDQTYELFPNLIPHQNRGGTGEFDVVFAMTKGIATIDPFKARSESVTVTATGTVDLVKRYVTGRARANLRGVAGIATSPLSHLLTEMRVSGPLDNIRVMPLGPGAVAKSVITGTLEASGEAVSGSARLSSVVLCDSLALPFEAIGLFRKDTSKPAN